MSVAEPRLPHARESPLLPDVPRPSTNDPGIGPCLQRLDDAIHRLLEVLTADSTAPV